MTRGFDDQGRHYDKNGNMTDWWTPEDADKFNKRAGLARNFISSIKVLPDLNANGKLTLVRSQIMVDLWFHLMRLKMQQKEPESSSNRSFHTRAALFLAYAGVWAANITTEEIRNRTKSDPHSLGCWRVMVPCHI